MLPNLGGPGWIKDILDVSIELDGNQQLVRDNGAQYTVPNESHNGRAALFSTKSVIKGTVILTAPPDCSIFTQQVNIKLNEYVTFLDPYVTNELQDASTSTNISNEECYIVGKKSFPFEIDLENITSAVTDISGEPRPFVDDYIGGSYGIKHALIVTVERPFYTFPVVHHLPICLCTCSPAPPSSRGREDVIQTEEEFEALVSDELMQHLVSCTLEEQQSEEFCDAQEERIRRALRDQIERDSHTPNHLLRLVDIDAKKFEFDYSNDCQNIGDTLSGILTVEDLKVVMANCWLFLFKTEYFDGEMKEILMFEKELMPSIIENKQEKGKGEGEGEYAMSCKMKVDLNLTDLSEDIRLEGIDEGSSDDGEVDFFSIISPTMTPIPSNTSEDIRDDKLSVSYFLKLAVDMPTRDGGDKYWVTNEIYLYRKMLPKFLNLDGTEEDSGSAV